MHYLKEIFFNQMVICVTSTKSYYLKSVKKDQNLFPKKGLIQIQKNKSPI